MSIRNDYHIHSEISPDGKSDMEHMCQSAIEKKIQEIEAKGVKCEITESIYTKATQLPFPGLKEELDWAFS